MVKYKNIKIVVSERVVVVGEASEISSGPFEIDRTGEHGPESEKKNCS